MVNWIRLRFLLCWYGISPVGALLLQVARPVINAACNLSTNMALAPESPLVLNEDVEVADSPGRGKGVFARRQIPCGVLVAPYTGDIRTDKELEITSEPNLYLFTLGNGLCIDGADPARSNWVRFLNHSRRRVNCDTETVLSPIGQFATGIAVRTTKDIAAGEELFIDYGDGYWQNMINNPIDHIKVHYG